MNNVRYTYLVTYDISEPKRLRKVFLKLRGYGNPIQYSVFICDLSEKEKALMIVDLDEIINYAEDRLMIIKVGLSNEKTERKIEVFGKKVEIEERGAVIV